MFYPLLPGHHENGYFWACTKDAAQKLSDKMNVAAANSTDGKVRLVLVSTNLTKMLSNTNLNQGLVRLLMDLMNDRSFPLSKSDVAAAFLAANSKPAKTKRKKDKKTGEVQVILQPPLNASIRAGMSVDKMAEILIEKLKPENSPFPGREAFALGLVKALADIADQNPKSREGLIKMLQGISEIKELGKKVKKLAYKHKSVKLFSDYLRICENCGITIEEIEDNNKAVTFTRQAKKQK
jgi:hypothetical protein